MRKTFMSLAVALVFVLALASVSSAGLYGQIWYGGYVHVLTPSDPPAAFGTVDADTGIFVFNPNTRPIKVLICVFNKKGQVMYGPAALFDGLLEGNPQPSAFIPAFGWGWITLGMTPIPASTLATKYTFLLLCYSDLTSPRAPVVEIKEVIYDVQPGQGVSPVDIFTPAGIKFWSETSLGGNSGTGYFPITP